MLKRIGPSIDPWGTPYKLDCASDVILSIFTECVLSCNNLRTTCCLHLIDVTNVRYIRDDVTNVDCISDESKVVSAKTPVI